MGYILILLGKILNASFENGARASECSKNVLHIRTAQVEFRCAQITSVCLADGPHTTDHLALVELGDVILNE